MKLSTPPTSTLHNKKQNAAYGGGMFWEKRDGFTQPFRESEQRASYFDDARSFPSKVAELAQLIGRSTFTLAITGAGFAGEQGATEEKAASAASSSLSSSSTSSSSAAAVAAAVTVTRARADGSTPSFEHRSLAQFGVRKIVHSVITTSTDGLQRKAGFPVEALVELHGSIFSETCVSCGKVFRRELKLRRAATCPVALAENGCETENSRPFAHSPGDIDVGNLRRQTLAKQTKPSKISWLKSTHETLRKCNECGGMLRDEVVGDGEVTNAE